VFWDNFNIHPETEYNARRDCLRGLLSEKSISQHDIKYIEHGYFGQDEFLSIVETTTHERCFICYLARFRSAVTYAKAGEFDYFSTTLLYSKYQKHEMIKQICEDLSHEYGVSFFYQDWRIYWQDGVTMSKEHNLYRQKYCGCIHSKSEVKYGKV
jgi:hypothetical protein